MSTQTKRAEDTGKPKLRRKKARKKVAPIPPHRRMLGLISDFLNDAECAQDAFNIVIPALSQQDEKTLAEIEKTVGLLRKDVKSEGPQRTRVMRHARTLAKHASKVKRSEIMFRGNALVGIVSRYDEYLAALLRSAYRRNPQRATTPDKSLTYEELLTLDSLDNVVELFIAKDIEGFLRESHEAQLGMIDREFKTGIVDNFKHYATFVELMERRNLLVHAGGKVSKYYLKKCRDIGYKNVELPKEGQTLDVSEEYFRKNIVCLSELAVRLGYALACRIYPEKLDDIHAHILEEVGFPLLMGEDWELAYRVFSFALGWPDKYIPKDSWRRYYAINAALALNHLHQHDNGIALLDEYDWSSQNPQLLLAVAVLKYKWAEAERIMSGMNGEEPFGEDHFRSWPIFKEFRETKEFRRAYKSVYGKRFVARLTAGEKEALKQVAKE